MRPRRDPASEPFAGLLCRLVSGVDQNRDFQRAEMLVKRLDALLPSPHHAPVTEPDWSLSVAFRYRKRSSGHGVLESIRNNPELRTLPVMVMTSSSAPQDRSTSENLQATHFITKPVGLNVLAGDIKIINALVKRSGV